MSDIVIKANSNQFTVNTDKGVRTGEYRDGEIRLTNGEPQAPQGPTQRVFESSQFGMEVNGGQVKIERPIEYNGAKVANPKSTDILGSLQDTAGRKCLDQRQAISNPADYTVAVGGTRVSLEVAMRLGYASIDGSGSVEVDHSTIAKDLNPAPKQAPAADYSFTVINPALHILRESVCRPLGIDPENFLARAIGNGASAARDLAQQIPGQDAAEIQEILVDAVQDHVSGVSSLLESYGLVPAGEGDNAVKFAFDTCEPHVGKALLHGTLAGSKSAFAEIARRYATKERY